MELDITIPDGAQPGDVLSVEANGQMLEVPCQTDGTWRKDKKSKTYENSISQTIKSWTQDHSALPLKCDHESFEVDGNGTITTNGRVEIVEKSKCRVVRVEKLEFLKANVFSLSQTARECKPKTLNSKELQVQNCYKYR